VVRVGSVAIDGAAYDHWLAIGEATVKMPKQGSRKVDPIAYVPPHFASCVSRLRNWAAAENRDQLMNRCERQYTAIQTRVLGFLITGYWLRQEAQAHHLSLTPAAVRSKFEEERRAHYPSTADFRHLQETSGQTIPDLEFAVETEMLSTRLLQAFAKRAHMQVSNPKTVAALNRQIVATWTPRTECRAGYVVRDCKEYQPPR
jgi:hypothetical protein